MINVFEVVIDVVVYYGYIFGFVFLVFDLCKFCYFRFNGVLVGIVIDMLVIVIVV